MNAGGLALGAAYVVQAPLPTSSTRRARGSPFIGPGLWDLTALSELRTKFGCDTVAVTPAELARKLTTAPARIIGVIRGRQEVGPRALGHRSLLLDARDIRLQARVNVLKRRQWYRPVAPMILESDVALLFEGLNASGPATISSPYMSRAPVFTPSASGMFPAVAHFDGTARVQTVSAEDDPWIFALLSAVKALIGWGVLGNTSMNSRGAPILNTVAAAIHLLREAPEIAGLVVGSSAVELRVGDKTRDVSHNDASVFIDKLSCSRR